MILARELLKELQEKNIPACVAGGYLRDMVLGRKPKDMDVVVFGNHVDLKNIDHVDAASVLDDVEHRVQNGVLIYQGRFRTTSYPVDVIEHLYTGTYKGMSVDMIFYKETYFNGAEVVDSFDMNINQGWMTLDRMVSPDVTTLKLHNLARCTEARVVKGFNMIMENYCKNHDMEIPGESHHPPMSNKEVDGGIPCL